MFLPRRQLEQRSPINSAWHQARSAAGGTRLPSSRVQRLIEVSPWFTGCSSDAGRPGVTPCQAEKAPPPHLVGPCPCPWEHHGGAGRGGAEGAGGARALPARLHSPSNRRFKVGVGGGFAGTHLHSGFGEVDFEGQLFPGVDVRIVSLGKDPLQLLQLRAGEGGADPALLPFLVDGGGVREELVGNWRKERREERPRLRAWDPEEGG